MFSLPFIFYYLFDDFTDHPQVSTMMGSSSDWTPLFGARRWVLRPPKYCFNQKVS